MTFILASASPARLLTLQRAGLEVEVIVSAVDESQLQLSDPEQLAAGLAELKAQAVFDRLEVAGRIKPGGQPLIIAGCDSVLNFESQPLGKPGSAPAAAALWRRLRGQRADLVTGHHVIVVDPAGRRQLTRAARTVVHFADLSDAEIDAYAASGEPAKVAGGFTIDGLGGPFIAGLEGDPHNVTGISLPLLRLMLADLGINWIDLWQPVPYPWPLGAVGS